jgi:hypothetical protein
MWCTSELLGGYLIILITSNSSCSNFLKKKSNNLWFWVFWNKKELWFWSFEKFGIKEPEILVFMEEALDIFEIYGYLPKNK